MRDPLPLPTLHDLSLVLVAIVEVGMNGLTHAARRMQPHLTPPPDLRVQSVSGAEYTGILLVENNEVIAGIVVKTSRGIAHERPDPRPDRSPLSTRHQGDSDDDDNDCRLPSWADYPSDEAPSWRR